MNLRPVLRRGLPMAAVTFMARQWPVRLIAAPPSESASDGGNGQTSRSSLTKPTNRADSLVAIAACRSTGSTLVYTSFVSRGLECSKSLCVTAVDTPL